MAIAQLVLVRRHSRFVKKPTNEARIPPTRRAYSGALLFFTPRTNSLADGHVRREMSPFFNMASDDRWADGKISGMKIIRIDANNSEKMRAKTRSELLQG